MKYADPRARFAPGPASEFFEPFSALRPGDRVVVCTRVSHENQDFASQEAYLRSRLDRLGVTVVDVVWHVGSGKDPLWLDMAVRKAREHGAGVKLIFETVDRAIRHDDYDPNDAPDLRAGTWELKRMKRVTGDIPLRPAENGPPRAGTKRIGSDSLSFRAGVAAGASSRSVSADRDVGRAFSPVFL